MRERERGAIHIFTRWFRTRRRRRRAFGRRAIPYPPLGSGFSILDEGLRAAPPAARTARQPARPTAATTTCSSSCRANRRSRMPNLHTLYMRKGRNWEAMSWICYARGGCLYLGLCRSASRTSSQSCFRPSGSAAACNALCKWFLPHWRTPAINLVEWKSITIEVLNCSWPMKSKPQSTNWMNAILKSIAYLK